MTPHGLTASSPSPDALRLSRLDRLLDQLGEHHLSIRQQVRVSQLPSRPCSLSWRASLALQGVSVFDLADRLKSLESTVQSELQVLKPLKVGNKLTR
jgi:hypothetical protein